MISVLHKRKKITACAVRYVTLLQEYALCQSLPKLRQLHAHIISSGLLSLLSQHHSAFLISNLASTYALCGHVRNAQKLFDELPQPNLFLYNAMIRMYSQNKGLSVKALELYADMLISCGRLRPNNYSYSFVIKACGDLSLIEIGTLVHGRAVKTGCASDVFVQNCVLAMYMNFGEVVAARWVFETMRHRTVVSWNTLVGGYLRNGYPEEALLIFHQMVEFGVDLDSVTFVTVLPACGQTKDLDLGRKIHSLMKDTYLTTKISLSAWNSLVDMYAKCGSIDEALCIFYQITNRDVVTWTALINGYMLNDDARGALQLCWPMQLDGVRPNSVTIASLLSACVTLRALKQGRCFHGWAVRHKIDKDVIVETALIDLYAKCNQIGVSFKLFDRASEKRTAPCNAILSGCVHNGLARDAIKNFRRFLFEAVNPDVATFNCLLPAYGDLADLGQADNLHGYLIKAGFVSCSDICSAFIDIYSKCGNLEYAHKMFSGVPKESRNIIFWSALIAAYGKHGHGDVAISLYKKMVQSGMKPNEVTFTSVLDACSHAGLVDEGLDLFKAMLKENKSIPSIDHYISMVDLLGRAGQLEEAYNLIRSMSLKANAAVWGALLGACVVHGNVKLGEVAASSLFELEPSCGANYILLAKIYASVGRWEEYEKKRKMINSIGLRKEPAKSFV